MQKIVTNILTDASARDSATVESALTDQAVAAPWGDVDSNGL
jgi:hypothetical protein